MLKDSTVVGLIRTSLSNLARAYRVTIGIGGMGKDFHGHWIVTVSIPDGLPANVSPQEFGDALTKVEHALQANHQVAVLFALARPVVEADETDAGSENAV